MRVSRFSPTSLPVQQIGIMVLVVALLVGALAIHPPQQIAEPSAHPNLLQMAKQNPTMIVAVLIQQRVDDPQLKVMITQHGGLITRSLPIVNGFVARVPAGLIPEIGRVPSVRWISPDNQVASTDCTGCYDGSKMLSAYIRTVGADQVWNRALPIRGRSIGVAVVDSGVNPQGDLFLRNTGTNRIVANVRATTEDYNSTPYDAYGHGNHVAGIIGGNGSSSSGQYIGIAPEVNIINVRVSDDQGAATTSSLVNGLQWVLDNRDKYNIRVVNISLTDSVIESYNVSALAAAVELLWFNNIVVVVAAGNSGDGGIAAPANDPFVITVGATNDRGTPDISDDFIPLFSASGKTVDGFAKPDLVAPGTNIVSLMMGGLLPWKYPQNIVQAANGFPYFRMSGTSMAAPMVTGAVALLLQDEPSLTPDQVKFRLKATARPFNTPARAGSGYLNIPAAIDGTTTDSANTGIAISQMLWDGANSTVWDSAKWSTAKWSTAKWSTAKWSTSNQ
jgi:serine protease AprX